MFASAAARAVQVIPSGEVIIWLMPPRATATNWPLPKVTEVHELASAAALALQVPWLQFATRGNETQDVPLQYSILDWLMLN